MGNHEPDGWDFELDQQYDLLDREDEDVPFDVGLATPFTASDLAVQFITRDHGMLWIPKKAIHGDSEVWEPGQVEGRLYIEEWCAQKKGLL